MGGKDRHYPRDVSPGRGGKRKHRDKKERRVARRERQVVDDTPPPGGEYPGDLAARIPPPEPNLKVREIFGRDGYGATARWTGPAVINVDPGMLVFLQLRPGQSVRIDEGEDFVVSTRSGKWETETTYTTNDLDGPKKLDISSTDTVYIRRFPTG